MRHARVRRKPPAELARRRQHPHGLSDRESTRCSPQRSRSSSTTTAPRTTASCTSAATWRRGPPPRGSICACGTGSPGSTSPSTRSTGRPDCGRSQPTTGSACEQADRAPPVRPHPRRGHARDRRLAVVAGARAGDPGGEPAVAGTGVAMRVLVATRQLRALRPVRGRPAAEAKADGGAWVQAPLQRVELGARHGSLCTEGPWPLAPTRSSLKPACGRPMTLAVVKPNSRAPWYGGFHR